MIHRHRGPILQESRIPVYAALAGAALLHLALPDQIAPGPSWLPVAIVVPLILPNVLASDGHGKARWSRLVGTGTMVAITLFVVGALGTLMWHLLTQPANHEEATLILRAAVPLWMANVIVFGLWYWRLDAGGPHDRETKHAVEHGFVFPQMTMSDEQRATLCGKEWRPMFFDYLFLAFNTSTAFSPTDTAVIGAWAKALTMVQTLISLGLLVIVAARAVNIL